MGFNDSLLKFNPKLFNYYEKKAKKINANLGRNSPNKQKMLQKTTGNKNSNKALKPVSIIENETKTQETIAATGRISTDTNDLVDPKFKSFRGAK